VPRHSISDAQKAQVLEALRSHPEPGSFGSFRAAAAAAGLDRRTIARAWRNGWPGDAAGPIAEMIELEKVAARAALRREQLAKQVAAATALATEDAAEARAREGSTLRALLDAAGDALRALHREKIGEYMERLARLVQVGDPGDPVPKGARRALRELADVIKTLGEGAAVAQRMGHLVLGEPTAIVGGEVGVRPVVPQAVTSEALIKEIEAATRDAERLRLLEEEAAAKAAPSKGNHAPV